MRSAKVVFDRDMVWYGMDAVKSSKSSTTELLVLPAVNGGESSFAEVGVAVVGCAWPCIQRCAWAAVLLQTSPGRLAPRKPCGAQHLRRPCFRITNSRPSVSGTTRIPPTFVSLDCSAIDSYALDIDQVPWRRHSLGRAPRVMSTLLPPLQPLPCLHCPLFLPRSGLW